MRRLFLFCVTISLAFVGSERARSQATIVTDGDLDVGGSVLQIGTPILVSSTTGINLALGPEALANVNPGTPQPEDGKWNTAIGPQALYSNEAGMHNTAVGYRSLRSFTDGCCNTAIGSNALYSNDDSEGNTAVGAGALFSNLNGFGNTAIGDNALRFNTAGSWNVALGHFAGLNATGSGNVLVGAAWLNAIGSDNILINNPGVASENAVIRIGTQGTQTKTFISGIDDQSLAVSANVVCVETTGQR